jgi:hypothetical protein
MQSGNISMLIGDMDTQLIRTIGNVQVANVANTASVEMKKFVPE